MRALKAVACLLAALAVLLSAPAAPAKSVPAQINVEMACSSEPYDDGTAPDAGWNNSPSGPYVVVPDPTNPPDGRTGYIIIVCVMV